MAIRINLLAEEQAAEELRRKNPVKLAIWVGGFFVAVAALFILKLQLDINFSKNDYAGVDKQWKDNIAKYAAVTNNMAKIAEIDRKLNALDKLSTNRFFWAPVLNALQQTMINDIQVVKISGDQKYVKEEAKFIGSGASKQMVPPRITTRARKTTINSRNHSPITNSFSRTCNGVLFWTAP
jgi:hypothetical protein